MLTRYCLNRHMTDLAIGIELLEGVARAMGDYRAADDIQALLTGLCVSDKPPPLLTTVEAH
ncbi:hypothetical protein DBV23_15985 [Edwardsiella ictaluri]|nr:hypothetical protein DBV23_15985 [Edwardsiella ictaluri]